MNQSNKQNEDLLEIFTQVQDIDDRTYSLIIEMIRKENSSDSDCIGFISNLNNQKQLDEQLTMHKDLEITYIKKMTNIIQQIQDHNFNKYNYSEEIYLELKQDLIKKISQDKKIIKFLMFLVLLTAIDNSLIQCGSNSLNLLVEMKVDLKNHNFENIRIKNTSLIGGNFVRCNLNGSKLQVNLLMFILTRGKITAQVKRLYKSQLTPTFQMTY